jgi:DNA-binding MurR/RpiR family transcriptional regulator
VQEKLHGDSVLLADMTILDKFTEAAPVLTPNERLLVREVMASPTSVALGTAGEFARQVGVHEATVSRLARKLGYASYAEFRDDLRREFIPTQDAALRLERTMSETSAGSILGDLARQEAEALLNIENFVKPEEITRAAELLIKAERVFFYGYGNAEMLAVMMVKRFRRFGRSAQQLSADPRSLAEAVLSFKPGDVVVTFAFRRPPRGYAALIESARQAGAATLVISGSVGATLAPQPDYLLAAPRGGSRDGFQTLTVPMTVCNALVIAAGLTEKDDTLKALDRLGELIRRFD